MNPILRRTLPAFLALGALSAQAQYLQTHGASLSVGGTGQFSTILEQNNVPVTVNVNPNGSTTTQAINQQQTTTWSAGFLTSLQFHPVAWAGVALNYGFNHYTEGFQYTYVNTGSAGTTNVPVDVHEFTGGYLFHPKRIPFQPYLEIGGGALDFAPGVASSQIRGTGLLETGFDIPTSSKHIAFRVSGRTLIYRAPNFYQPAISTRAWRSTEEPAISAVYRF